MLRSNGLQGLDHHASGREDHADHKRRQGFKTPVSVRLILISRSRGDAHPAQDDTRCEHIASELEPRRDDRRRVGQQADDDVAAREHGADGHANQSDPARGSVRFVEHGHRSIVPEDERAASA